MAPKRAIKKFAYVTIDKGNASRGTAVGNVLLCVQARKQAPNDTVNTIGDFEVWDTADQVKARSEKYPRQKPLVVELRASRPRREKKDLSEQSTT